MKTLFTFILALLLIGGSVTGQEFQTVRLPDPEKTGGMPLMEALSLRHTSRTFSKQELPQQLLSNLLWAAFGINREDGKRTAPSTYNWQEIDIYVLLKDGTYIYDAKQHALVSVLKEDIRRLAGIQEFVWDAPLSLIFIADHSKMIDVSDDERNTYAFADAAFISQNIYLFCASEGLNTGVRAYIDKPALAKKLNLGAGQVIILGQSVGYPED